MPLLILALFIAVPIAEIAVFIMAGEAIGLWPTLLTVIVTAVAGTWLMQRQGLSAMARTQASLQAGELPVESMIDGVYLLVAGAFLLTPGFITDAFGFLLFVPPFRRWLGRKAFAHFTRNMDIHVSTGRTSEGPDRNRRPPGGPGPIIDGEYEHMDGTTTSEPHGSSTPDHRSTSPWRNRPDGPRKP